MTNLPVPASPRNFSTYDFEDQPVRIDLDENGDPQFVASDVCQILGLANPSQVVSRLDEDEKSTIQIMDSDGRPRKLLLINQSGLYSLILTSNKTEAKRFKRWITHEVLPSIRKTGSYSLQNLSPAEIILVQAQRLVDHERQLANHDNRIGSLEARAQARDQWTQHYTVIGYRNLRGLSPLTQNEAISWGKRAAHLSRERGVSIGKTSDPRFGEVGTYRIDVLDEIAALAESEASNG
jgi:prophage antirepressor-like protein